MMASIESPNNVHDRLSFGISCTHAKLGLLVLDSVEVRLRKNQVGTAAVRGAAHRFVVIRRLICIVQLEGNIALFCARMYRSVIS